MYYLKSSQIAVSVLVLGLALTLTSCLGATSGNDSKTSLLITEVSSTTYNDDKPWFEIYNGTKQVVNLADYQIRTLSQQRVNPYNYYDVAIFSIPQVMLSPHSYVVVAGQGTDTRVSGEGIVYLLNSPDVIPRWSDRFAGNGFIELLKDGKTVDFVRFGANETEPVSTDAWQGSSALALPRGKTKHGFSIVRDLQNSDTNTAADWSSRSFATAGGPNDVPAFAVDFDADGIPDSAEVKGGKFAGLDLYAMGARTNKKDIFIEIDYMDNATHKGLIPQKEALNKLVEAFANNGINIHLDVGNMFAGGFDPSNYNLGNKRSKVPYNKSIGLSQNKDGLNGRASFYEYKDRYMEINRKQIFHYLLMANSQKINGGSGGSSGRAEINGNDIIITIGSWNLSDGSPRAKNILVNYQAGTIMHELGHNLGLLHGGDVGENFKPNYLSIMNYMYQLRGLGKTLGSSVGDRFYHAKAYKHIGLCDLAQSPCTSSFVISYSHGRGREINENSISESAGIGYGNSWVDYNNNGNVDSAVSLNINGDAVKSISANGNKKILRDYDDWANLNLRFIRTWSGNSGSTLALEPQLVDVVANDYQQWSEEEAPSEEFFDWLEQTQ